MITSLDIRNYALIDRLHVDFSEGLTIITGETGAGKSIMLGGLGLIMGQRADTRALFDPSEKCIVEAHFKVGKYDLKHFFETHELDYDEELVVRREILPSGKTRAFVNDTPTRLNVLQDLSAALIDLHLQFDTLDIHQVSFQLRMLDALAENTPLLREYAHAYRSYQAAQREYARLLEEQERLRKEADFVAFQLQEFEELQLEAGEIPGLEQELKTLESAGDIKKILGQAGFKLVEHERSVASQLREITNSTESLRGINQKLDTAIEALSSLSFELEDVGQRFSDLAEETDLDPQRLEEVNARLSGIYKLMQKHGAKTEEALFATLEDYQQRSKTTQRVDRSIANLKESLSTQKRVLTERALQLRERRQAVVPDFTDRVHERLARLAMPNARLSIVFEALDEPGPSGLDQVDYLFSANKGARLQAIKDVASGGELSRLTLVTKSLVAASIPLPTLVFDEIDAGVSGDVSLRMGGILHDLSAEHQVVVITHSAQVASQADKHYFVYKEDIGERMATRIRELDTDGRIQALAVMLSSDPPSAPAIANATEMLASGRR